MTDPQRIPSHRGTKLGRPVERASIRSLEARFARRSEVAGRGPARGYSRMSIWRSLRQSETVEALPFVEPWPQALVLRARAALLRMPEDRCVEWIDATEAEFARGVSARVLIDELERASRI